MARYGNILSVFGDFNPEDIQHVFETHAVDFEQVENTFFVETTSKQNTKEVVNALEGLTIEFVFFHNHNADGSVIKEAGLTPAQRDHINKILFE